MSTPIDLAALRALAEKASPGPWTLSESDYVFGTDRNTMILVAIDQPKADNTAFIAAANPRTLIALLDRLAAASAVVEAARRDMQAKAYEPGMPERVYAHLCLGMALAAYDRAIAGQQKQEGT